jgi:16S rRNA (adenine1518-N6/adenine1519-N6)-dimethyltransferase
LVAGNLPFNVGTQILLLFIGELQEPNWAVMGITKMVLMFQLEVAQRLVAVPGSKAYNPLSILVNAKSQTQFLFKVPAKCFHPIPKVDAGVVLIEPLAKSHLAELSSGERTKLKKIVKTAFSTRRKNLKNALAGLLSPEELSSCNISPQLRAESLSLFEYLTLARFLHKVRPE